MTEQEQKKMEQAVGSAVTSGNDNNGSIIINDHYPAEALSAEATEMLERTPSWLMRWGVLSLLLVLSILITVAVFVKYPDTLEGKATVTTDPLPIKLKALTGGRVARIFVKDGDSLGINTPVAEIENPTGYDNILALQRCTDKVNAFLRSNSDSMLISLQDRPLSALGEAQVYYNQLQQQISTLLLLRKEKIYSKRTKNLQQQIGNYRSMARISAEENNLVTEELHQANERFRANEQLYRDKVISKQEYYDEAAKLRQKKLSLEQQRRSSIQNNITIGDNNKQILELEYDRDEKQRGIIAAIEEAQRNICNYIQTWQQRYLLQAPYDGKVRFLRPLQVNETTAAGEELFAVLPQHCRYSAQIMLQASGIGKLQAGQKVHLLLDNYPYNEYGYLEGTVERYSTMPELPQGNASNSQQQTLYRVYVSLPDLLVTSYHRQIPFSPELGATGRIITHDKNLLLRLVENAGKMNK